MERGRVFFLTCKDGFESAEENEKVMKSRVPRILAGKPLRHAVELCNTQVFARLCVCVCVCE